MHSAIRSSPARHAGPLHRAQLKTRSSRPARVGVGVADLLTTLPVLEQAISPTDHPLAHRSLGAPLLILPPGAWDSASDLERHCGFLLVVVSGTVLKETRTAGRTSMQIFGADDVLLPLLVEGFGSTSARHVVHEEATIVVLDDRFRAASRRWPLLHEYVQARLVELAERTASHLSLLHRPRADDRILGLFDELAERWGRVTLEGVVIPLHLTHELIGQLVGARRTTVAEAVSALAAREALVRLSNGGWLLPAEPPAGPVPARPSGSARSFDVSGAVSAPAVVGGHPA